jgi:vanillate O-demethylase ferredoxin subunit
MSQIEVVVNESNRESDGSFDLKIASTGQVIHVPKDKTTLQAMLDSGLDIPFSCENGICGTCLTAVVEGEPEHKDQFLTEAEHAANDIFTPCCSRSKSRILVVDI